MVKIEEWREAGDSMKWEEERTKPWYKGGKEEVLVNRNITMTHDELAFGVLGAEVYQKVLDAGFVLIPKSLRDDWFKKQRQSTK